MFLRQIVRIFTYPKSSVSLNLEHSLRKCSRNFHRASNLYIRMFMEHENKYAYSILENKGYAISLCNNIYINNHPKLTLSEQEFKEMLLTDWSKKSHIELFNYFPKFGLYCSEHNLSISNEIFDTYIDYLTDSFKLATDKELESIFHALNNWPEVESIRTRNFIEVWTALDDECLKRYKNWSHSELLSYIPLFYMVNVTKYSDFFVKSLQKLATKAKQLTPGQLVQTMFFIGIWRKSPFDMHNLEIEIKRNYDLFTIDDLAIMSMGFFKSKTPIRDMDLVLKMIDTIITNSKNVHEVSLAALLKLIRYSTKLTTDDRIYRLLDALQHEVPRLSIMCNVHLALVGTSTLNLHEECLHKIAKTVIESISLTRMKDLERLVLTYSTFNLVPKTEECFFLKVIEELRKPERIPEINSHGRSFACCIAYLGLAGFYPVDLIDKVFNKDFLKLTYGTYCYNYGREILTLSNVSKIFCPDVKDHLQDKHVQIMAKKYTDYMPSEDYIKQYNITERMVLDVMKVLRETRGGYDYVVGEHILSHYQRGDIVICNDLSGAPVVVKDKFPARDFGLLRRPPDGNTWIVLVIAGRNAIINGTDNATGFFTSKVRELEAMGYHAALVPWSKYSKLTKLEEKAEFLNNLITYSLRKTK
nr:FAST kinase domain-containing protein 5, mitochondrial [Helicoverpa armigera]